LPAIPSTKSAANAATWSIGLDQRPTTPRSARNRPTAPLF
jgi:hypothetical protein